MIKSIPSLLAILITALVTIIEINPTSALSRPALEGFRSHWLSGSFRDKNDLLKKWFEQKRVEHATESRSVSPFGNLHAAHEFKGCVDPSEPFQCPQSEKCVALQFICDGHPGDCPGNTDENEEICIAAKRPAKENIEKFLQAEHALHGSRLFVFIFGENIAKAIEENGTFWTDALASAFSVSKNLRSFGEKLQMTPDSVAHLRNVIEIIHDGRLEEIPKFAQEAVSQGLASLIEKLYDSGFMDQ